MKELQQPMLAVVVSFYYDESGDIQIYGWANFYAKFDGKVRGVSTKPVSFYREADSETNELYIEQVIQTLSNKKELTNKFKPHIKLKLQSMKAPLDKWRVNYSCNSRVFLDCSVFEQSATIDRDSNLCDLVKLCLKNPVRKKEK